MGVQDLSVGPVIPVSNLEASREFYESKLGLRGEPAPGGWALQAGGDTRIFSSTERTRPVAHSGRWHPSGLTISPRRSPRFERPAASWR